MNNSDLRTLSAIPRSTQGAILVATIGGVAEIGMNWTIYGADDRFILVDAGTAFAPREVAGVEAVMPDPKLFELLGSRLKGLVVSHFHEDHVGAIHRLWPKYARCPIFAPPFAAMMLSNRFQEAGTRGDVAIKTMTPGAELDVGSFHLRTIKVAHSTPDCLAFAIEHGDKRIIHTGDWKLDPEPGIGPKHSRKASTPKVRVRSSLQAAGLPTRISDHCPYGSSLSSPSRQPAAEPPAIQKAAAAGSR